MPLSDGFAPAKVNLTLHVTGQRCDGYHLLDSLVVFADVGDRVTAREASVMSLTVSGPRAAGVPSDQRNLCWKAADWLGVTAALMLEKHLPAAAGIGGGSSDAAAVLRVLSEQANRPVPQDGLAQLGADIPVCLLARAARMSGIGGHVTPVMMPTMPAVLVNPGVDVATPAVFKTLTKKDNSEMSDLPEGHDRSAVFDWLTTQRNDLEAPAIALQPVIANVLSALQGTAGARLARMSGSGATCFALYDDLETAEAAGLSLRSRHPDWWITACTLS